MVKGAPNFDAIIIGEIKADFTKTQLHLEGVAAFANSQTGTTHGWTKATGGTWSQETMRLLSELRESMEQDMARLHFSNAAKDKAVEPTRESSTGLGEFLGVNVSDGQQA